MLLQIFSWFWQWKDFENRLIFDKVKGFNKNCAIFWATLYVQSLNHYQSLAYLHRSGHSLLDSFFRSSQIDYHSIRSGIYCSSMVHLTVWWVRRRTAGWSRWRLRHEVDVTYCLSDRRPALMCRRIVDIVSIYSNFAAYAPVIPRPPCMLAEQCRPVRCYEHSIL